MQKPPPTPQQTLQRVLRTAQLDGLTLVIVASLGVVISLGDWFGMAVGAAVIAGGWMELSGRNRLLAGSAAGMRLLVRSQLVVLVAIEIYCAVKLGSNRNYGVSPDLRSSMAELGIDLDELEPTLRRAFNAVYGAVALLTLVYQGGMARYYARRVSVVKQAIEGP